MKQIFVVVVILTAIGTCAGTRQAHAAHRENSFNSKLYEEGYSSDQCRYVTFRRHHRAFCADFLRWQISCAVNPMRIQPYTGNFYDGEYEKYLDIMRHPGWEYERETGQRCPG